MAKKFRFRLEKVLELRKGEAAQARLRFAEAETVRRRKDEEIEETQQYYERLLATGHQGVVSVRSLESQWYHARAVQAQIAALERERVRLVEIEELRRSELAEAMTRQKVLEKLKENKHSLYLHELSREEQQLMDDIAQQGGRSPFSSIL